ncbi:MAG TPA: flagellar assembly protein FliW [Mariprofundaceae bacterium]|nr:flagellar assembly protein FliW [Mariprofundaceae bacterium]
MLAAQEQPQNLENKLREFTFPRGIAGFSGATRFAFIYEGQGDMLCLQSIDQPEASFILTPWDASRLGQAPQLSKEQLECLSMSETQDIRWFVVLNPFADKTWVTANLKAPIAINEAEQTGLQYIRNQKQLELRYKWMKQPTP